jgi:hypothetical protein
LTEAFYRREGERLFAPLTSSTGPWDPRNQNGVALAGLMAHVFETAGAPEGLDLARYHIDILKPTPMAPVEVTVERLRGGRRLQVLEAHLRVDGELTARASAALMRTAPTPPWPLAAATLDPPEALDPARRMKSRSAIREMLESRLRYGGADELGPGAAWLKFTGDIVEGSPITPFVQAAMASDIGSGLSSVVDWRTHTFANVDISLNLSRAPVGEWVHIDSETITHGQGRALVNTILSDRRGEFARAHQTLFIEARG